MISEEVSEWAVRVDHQLGLDLEVVRGKAVLFGLWLLVPDLGEFHDLAVGGNG